MTDDLSKGERTRTDIIEAAHRLFVEQGYHGTSMRQIAEEAGIALGGIYNHFSGKEEIFENVITEFHPFFRLLPVLVEVEGETVEDLVRNTARTIMEHLRQQPEFFNLMFIELVEFKARHIPQVFDKLFPRGLGFMQRLTEAKGTLRDIPLPSILATFFGMMVANFVLQSFAGPDKSNMLNEEVADHMVDIFLHGILVEESTHGSTP